jgi:transcriptional regulator with XRE-family HTH domain
MTEPQLRADDQSRDSHGLGASLRELRTGHGYSMRKLASLSGVSASLISEVERGRVEPSITVLKRLANALDVTLIYFFSEERASTDRVVRKDERRRIRQPAVGPGIIFELLGPDTGGDLEPVYGRYDAGATMGAEPISHEGEEWGYVIRGRLKVWVGDEVYFINEGDAIAFPSTTPHRMANAMPGGVTEYIWVNSKRSF